MCRSAAAAVAQLVESASRAPSAITTAPTPSPPGSQVPTYCYAIGATTISA